MLSQRPLYGISEGHDRYARPRNPFYCAALRRGLLLASLPIRGPPTGLETELAVAFPVYLPQFETSVLELNPFMQESLLPFHTDAQQLAPTQSGRRHSNRQFIGVEQS